MIGDWLEPLLEWTGLGLIPLLLLILIIIIILKE